MCVGRGTDKCKGPEVGSCLVSRKAERQEGSGWAEVGGVGGPTRGAHRLRCVGMECRLRMWAGRAPVAR